MDTSGIPTDGPETVLGQAARRLNLRYSRTYVARAVASHPQPNSLLALVTVAGNLGMKTTAGMIDPSALDELDFPAIVHFGGKGGGGFGVLEGVSADGFKIWDSVNGVHLVERNAFLKHWSGIVALIERSEDGGPSEKGYLRNRLTEMVFSGYEPPALIGSRAAPLLKFIFGTMLAALLFLGVVALPTEDRVAATALTVLSILGLFVTIVTGISIGAQDSALSDRICARGRFVDCHSVLSSRYSRIFGIPLSDVGIAFFGSVTLLIATAAVADGMDIWLVVGPAYAATLPFSLMLVGIQVAMRQLCTLCLAVHIVNLSAAGIGWIWLRRSELSTESVGPPVLLLALYLFLILFLAIPYFRKHQGLRVMTGMYRRISDSPFASLAEILTEEPAALIPTDCAVPLEGPTAEHELVVFVHPSCGKCAPVLQQVNALSQSGKVKAYVGLAPKDPQESDRRMCSAVVAVGLSVGSDRLIEGYHAAKKQLRAMLSEDPVTILASELAIPQASIVGAFEEARRRTHGAETLVDAHADGTPAVFFNSRIYRGDVAHLVFLLEHHTELLAQTLLEREDTRREVEVYPS